MQRIEVDCSTWIADADAALALPVHLVPLIAAAQADTLKKGPVQLESGMVFDLAGYVLAWAEDWPLDMTHRQRRLNEALRVMS
ncbi:hypothetical protein [Deinococcus alpinitundrae]|uniref:hypothetical protein n=1 Tax=Deinococcus alpinitundrae TaxID=468913 RepID=UPI00137B4A04|nr:hypothetical protein [Deinococcus alpinitundrae]